MRRKFWIIGLAAGLPLLILLILISVVNRNQCKRLKTGSVANIALSPNGNLLAVSGYGYIDLWSVQSQKRLWHRAEIPSYSKLFFSLDGKHVIAMYNQRGFAYEIETGKVIKELKVWRPSSYRYRLHYHLSPDGRYFLTQDSVGKGINRINIWTPLDGNLVKSFIPNRDFERCFCFSPSGKLFAIWETNSQLSVYDTHSWRLRNQFQLTSPQLVANLCFSDDEKELISLANQNRAKWRIKDGKKIDEQNIGSINVSNSYSVFVQSGWNARIYLSLARSRRAKGRSEWLYRLFPSLAPYDGAVTLYDMQQDRIRSRIPIEQITSGDALHYATNSRYALSQDKKTFAFHLIGSDEVLIASVKP